MPKSLRLNRLRKNVKKLSRKTYIKIYRKNSLRKRISKKRYGKRISKKRFGKRISKKKYGNLFVGGQQGEDLTDKQKLFNFKDNGLIDWQYKNMGTYDQWKQKLYYEMDSNLEFANQLTSRHFRKLCITSQCPYPDGITGFEGGTPFIFDEQLFKEIITKYNNLYPHNKITTLSAAEQTTAENDNNVTSLEDYDVDDINTYIRNENDIITNILKEEVKLENTTNDGTQLNTFIDL